LRIISSSANLALVCVRREGLLVQRAAQRRVEGGSASLPFPLHFLFLLFFYIILYFILYYTIYFILYYIFYLLLFIFLCILSVEDNLVFRELRARHHRRLRAEGLLVQRAAQRRVEGEDQLLIALAPVLDYSDVDRRRTRHYLTPRHQTFYVMGDAGGTNQNRKYK
jgi:hypothetical protein